MLGAIKSPTWDDFVKHGKSRTVVAPVLEHAWAARESETRREAVNNPIWPTKAMHDPTSGRRRELKIHSNSPAGETNRIVDQIVSMFSLYFIKQQSSALQDRLARAERGRQSLLVATQKVDEIAQLPDDWDSYGALRPSGTAISMAHKLVVQLWTELGDTVDEAAVPWTIAPLADGGVQLEWRGSGGAVEVEIDPNGSLNYLREHDEDVVAQTAASSSIPTQEVLDQICQVISG